MSKPVIAVDVDDVLVPHFEGLVAWYNQKFGTHLTEAHNHSPDTTPWGGGSAPEAIKRAQGYFESEAFQNEQPYKEAIAALEKLSKSYELVIITGRDEIIEEITLRWLDRHFPKFFKEIHFTRQYNLEGKSRPKSEVIKSVGASYFIDDYPKAVLEVAAIGIDTILFGEYGWNQVGELPANVTRCKDWAAVLEYFDAR